MSPNAFTNCFNKLDSDLLKRLEKVDRQQEGAVDRGAAEEQC